MAGNFDPIYVQENIAVNTSATELVPTGGASSNRTHLVIYNKGDETIYYGPTNGVTAVGVAQGNPLYKDQFAVLPLDSNLTVYAITASGSSTVLIEELTCVDSENF